jgi:hypothetical protein
MYCPTYYAQAFSWKECLENIGDFLLSYLAVVAGVCNEVCERVTVDNITVKVKISRLC